MTKGERSLLAKTMVVPAQATRMQQKIATICCKQSKQDSSSVSLHSIIPVQAAMAVVGALCVSGHCTHFCSWYCYIVCSQNNIHIICHANHVLRSSHCQSGSGWKCCSTTKTGQGACAEQPYYHAFSIACLYHNHVNGQIYGSAYYACL